MGGSPSPLVGKIIAERVAATKPATFVEVLNALRASGGRRGRRYVFSDAERDRIAGVAEAARGSEPQSREAADRALDALERELEPFIVDPAE